VLALLCIQGASVDTGNQAKSFASRGRRTLFSFATVASSLFVVVGGGQSRARALTTSTRPTKEELASVFSYLDDEPTSDTYGEGFSRLDENDDAIFYQSTRFVEHIDLNAVNALTRYHGELIEKLRSLRGGNKIDLLDICSSWTSHIPPPSAVLLGNVVGLGMNALELERNERLTQRIVQDLNKNPKFPSSSLADSSIDLVLLQLSIDYLTQPIEVLEEAMRCLRPDGVIAISFSNRVFIDKVVANWSGKADIDHIESVGQYLFSAAKKYNKKSPGASKEPSVIQKSLKAMDLSPSRSSGDPLYVVTYTR